MSSDPNCPLCDNDQAPFFATTSEKSPRSFHKCQNCGLIFCHSDYILKPDAEVQRYESHENHLRTAGYEKFLKKLLTPVLERVATGATGLDFGCGPYPMMAELAGELGHTLESYDPFFRKKTDLLEKKYSFITCSEVAEHFCNPRKEFDLLVSLLQPGGHLGVMTSFFEGTPKEFEKWHYVRDDTHISIFNENVIRWIAKEYNLSILYLTESVVIFISQGP